MLSSEKGSYLLTLRAKSFVSLQVGSLALFGLEPKQYLYVGSALGPGGLRARLNHHLKTALKPHWHIDYLRQHAEIERIFYCISSDRLEHIWATALSQTDYCNVPLRNFGSSDCNCPAHLFSLERKIDDKEITALLSQNGKYQIRVFEPQPKS